MQEAERNIDILIIAQCHIFGGYNQQDIPNLKKIANSLLNETLLLHGITAIASMRCNTGTASKPHINSSIWYGKTIPNDKYLLICSKGRSQPCEDLYQHL